MQVLAGSPIQLRVARSESYLNAPSCTYHQLLLFLPEHEQVGGWLPACADRGQRRPGGRRQHPQRGRRRRLWVPQLRQQPQRHHEHLPRVAGQQAAACDQRAVRVAQQGSQGTCRTAESDLDRVPQSTGW